MGVPGLFAYIRKKYPDCLERWNRQRFDCLYIDGNAMLHVAAQKVYNYGNHKRFLKKTKAEPRDVMKHFFRDIVELVEETNPSTMVFIAIDGAAPIAKQIQQRQRRFLSSTQEKPFESNQLTPGTEFMEELDVFMKRKCIKYCGKKRINIVYSGSNVEGEGEHKILEYLRLCKSSLDHVIYGVDGDIFNLVLSINEIIDKGSIRMLRFDPDSPSIENSTFFSPRSFIDSLVGEIEGEKGNMAKYIPYCFVILGMFVGNDFLPRMRMFLTLEAVFDLFFQSLYCYREKGIEDFDAMTYIKVSIDLLADMESECLERNVEYEIQKEEKFRDHILLESLVDKTLDYEEYRKGYYEKLLKISEGSVKELCKEYIKGVLWNYHYYKEGLGTGIKRTGLTWRYAYRHHYCPLPQDLKEYLDNPEIPNLFTGEGPVNRIVQLICVLPSKNSHLLKDEYRKYMAGDKYPDTFEIDYSGKTYEYQGIVLIPFVDNYEELEKDIGKNIDRELFTIFYRKGGIVMARRILS